MGFRKNLLPAIYILLSHLGLSYSLTNQNSITIQLQYSTEQIVNTTQSFSQSYNLTVFEDGVLNYTFKNDQSIFNCANLHLFVLNQTEQNNNYTWVINNINSTLNIIVQSGYGNPTVTNLNCTEDPCVLFFTTQCYNYYSNNFISASVYFQQSKTLITQLEYYTQCNIDMYLSTIQIQWGFVLTIVTSVILVIVSSKFQQAQSFNNFTLYVNYVVVAIYCALTLTKLLLIFFQVNHIIQVIDYICIVGSFIFGPFSVMVCFSQFMYFTKIGFVQYGVKIGPVNLRIMDVFGFLLGAGLLCAWFFLNRNVIISDFVFLMIFVTLMKIVKFGSLKMLILLFGLNFIILCIFYKTQASIDSSYQDNDIIYFNNPLFLLFPNIIQIPNSKCAWYSIITISYAGFYLCYLERFDKNNSSVIYGRTFIISYIIGTAIWLVVSLFSPFQVMYQLMTIPITTIILTIFAYRRGELPQIWNGDFYDEQRTSYSNLLQLNQNLDAKKSEQAIPQSLFEKLKYQNNKDTSNQISSNKRQIQMIRSQKSKQKPSDQASLKSAGAESIQNSMKGRDPAWKSQLLTVNKPENYLQKKQKPKS